MYFFEGFAERLSYSSLIFRSGEQVWVDFLDNLDNSGLNAFVLLHAAVRFPMKVPVVWVIIKILRILGCIPCLRDFFGMILGM